MSEPRSLREARSNAKIAERELEWARGDLERVKARVERCEVWRDEARSALNDVLMEHGLDPEPWSNR